MKVLEPEWVIPLPEKALDGCIHNEHIYILARVGLVYSKNSNHKITLLILYRVLVQGVSINS